MEATCNFCNKHFINIGDHVVKKHNLTSKEYYNTYLKNVIKTKTCTKCKKEKSINDFNKHKKHIDNLQNICKECKKINNFIYNKNNKLNKKEYDKKYKLNMTQEQINKSNARRRLLYKNNDIRKIQNKKWKHNNKNKILLMTQKRRIILKTQIGDFTTNDWENIKKYYNYKCAYCGLPKKLTIDHIIPLSIGGKHDKNNIAPACINCNSSKHNNIWTPVKVEYVS
jgi:5-methylcytosine-specific restriction endonuclease McrA